VLNSPLEIRLVDGVAISEQVGGSGLVGERVDDLLGCPSGGGMVSGTLTVVASGVPAAYLLPETVVVFQRAHPGVRVRIVSGNSAQTMDALRSHRPELGVVGGFAAAPENEAEPTRRRGDRGGGRARAGRPVDVAAGSRSSHVDRPQ